MKAMIFAAGLGTRLKPYTDTMPKALVPVQGKPMLWHQVQKLKAAGVDELVVNIHHFADQIVDYVHSEGDFGIKVHFSDERELLLDTGGGLMHARRFLEAGSEPFLIHNVDIFSNLDLGAFIAGGLDAAGMQNSRAEGALPSEQPVAKLLVSDRDSSRKLLFDEDGRLCGWKNLKTGQVKGPAAEPGCKISDGGWRELSFGGVHLLSPEIFHVFDVVSTQLASSAPERYRAGFSIIDFYLDICGQYPVKAYTQPGLELVDVGKTDTLAQLEIP